MLIHWCHKGIAARPSFGDDQAVEALSTHGIVSRWQLSNAATPAGAANSAAQAVLHAAALDAHVNSYSWGGVDSPYISLAAGCYEYQGDASPAVHRSAIAQAARFATDHGKSEGYLFKLWVITSPKPAAELPGVAEEVRDLNLFHGFHRWHHQGEITAKLVIPRRQILSVLKLDPTGRPTAWNASGYVGAIRNNHFVPPERISNVIEAL